MTAKYNIITNNPQEADGGAVKFGVVPLHVDSWKITFAGGLHTELLQLLTEGERLYTGLSYSHIFLA